MRDSDDMATHRATEPSRTGGTAVTESLDWEPVTDSELVALALSADPDARPDADAVPLDDYLGWQPGLLPLWYMPRPLARPGSRWRLAVVVAVVGAFLVIEALGLCSTFGHVTIG
jgi:hypothetical protein